MPQTIKIAVPTDQGQLSEHFGQAPAFRIFDIEDGRIVHSREEVSPPHEPGVIPRWFSEQGVDMLIAGCIGATAAEHFLNLGVQVISGAPGGPADALVQEFLAHNLVTTGHYCQCNHH